jgi:hypothetical protein
VAVLRSALSLGIKPSHATLRAMLSCCADLESRPGKTPLGLAAGPGFSLQGLGYVDLGQVLAACQEAVQEQQQQQQQQTTSSTSRNEAADAAGTGLAGFVGKGAVAADLSGSSSSSSSDVHHLAADLLRTWAFNSTFEYVDGVMTHGPAWALAGDHQQQGPPLLSVDLGGIAAAASAAAGV